MLNWISLYLVNMLLSTVKELASPYTLVVNSTSPGCGVQGLVQVRAAAGDVLNEIGGENGADGVEAPQEGGGNAVEPTLWWSTAPAPVRCSPLWGSTSCSPTTM